MSLDVRGEIIKLGRELGTDVDDLAFLGAAERDDVHRLRVAVEDALDRRNRGIYERIESASRLLPANLALKIARMSFPPLIVARVSESIPPERGRKLIQQTPTDYMAELLMYMDPGRMREAVQSFPTEMMVPLIRELVRREEFVTLGRYLGVLTDEQIPAVVALFDDGRTLLLTGFHAEDPSRLDVVVQAMSDEQVAAVTDAAARHGLEHELETVLAHLPADVRRRLEDGADA